MFQVQKTGPGLFGSVIALLVVLALVACQNPVGGGADDGDGSSPLDTIEQYNGSGEIDVPAENYAEYAISGDNLSITFYDDDSKETAFGTVEAQRLYLALIYQGEIDGSPDSYEKWIQVYNDDVPIDVWYGDSTEGMDSSEGTYTLGNGLEVAADATAAGIASDGSVSEPDLYYDSRADPPTGFTNDQLINDASVTVAREGPRYLLTVSYTLDGGGSEQKYFNLAVTESYDQSEE